MERAAETILGWLTRMEALADVSGVRNAVEARDRQGKVALIGLRAARLQDRLAALPVLPADLSQARVQFLRIQDMQEAIYGGLSEQYPQTQALHPPYVKADKGGPRVRASPQDLRPGHGAQPPTPSSPSHGPTGRQLNGDAVPFYPRVPAGSHPHPATPASAEVPRDPATSTSTPTPTSTSHHPTQPTPTPTRKRGRANPTATPSTSSAPSPVTPGGYPQRQPATEVLNAAYTGDFRAMYWNGQAVLHKTPADRDGKFAVVQQLCNQADVVGLGEVHADGDAEHVAI